MSKLLGLGALAVAALVSGTASATEIAVGESRLVIDVEFWGREYGNAEGPNGGGDDITVFGAPVHGTFRIFADRAPRPQPATGVTPIRDGQSYGADNGNRPDGASPNAASFVTSRWLSPLPNTFGAPTHQVSAFPGSGPNDYVGVGDRVRVTSRPGGLPPGSVADWFLVSDQFQSTDRPPLPNSSNPHRFKESLEVNLLLPLDFIDGFGLDQQFELDDLKEVDAGLHHGRFQSQVDGITKLLTFVVDRVHVTPHVCKP